jgi:putative permease
MKQVAWYTAVSLAAISAVFLLWQFRTAILLFILSLMVAAILRPIVDFLTRHGFHQGLALLITYLAVAALVAALGLFFGGSVIAELNALVIDIPGGYEQIRTHWLTGSILQQAIARIFPDSNDLFQIITGGQWDIFIQNFLGMTLGSLDLLGKIAIVFVLSIYWGADQEHFKRLWLSLFPSESRAHWREIWQNIESEIGSYLRSELIQSLLAVVLLGSGYQLIGLKYPVLLAVLGAVSWMIIWFGGLGAVAIATLSGLSINLTTGLLAFFLTTAVLTFLEFIVEPRLYSRQRLSSILLVMMVLVLVKQFGVIGFLAAPPLAAVIQIVGSQLIRPMTPRSITLEAPPTVKIDLLRDRLNSVQAMLSGRSESPPPEIINLVARLDTLIDRTNHEDQFIE